MKYLITAVIVVLIVVIIIYFKRNKINKPPVITSITFPNGNFCKKNKSINK